MSVKYYQVELRGWEYGFKTIDLTKMIVARTSCGLSEAFRIVNSVLNDGTETLSFPSEAEAVSFARDASALGVKASLRTD